MKVAIASTGNSLESAIDAHFGRCSYFVIVDTETKAVEFIRNPNKEAEEGTGTASVHLMASLSVRKIISGGFGMKIKPLLDSQTIQMIILPDPGKKIKEILELLTH